MSDWTSNASLHLYARNGRADAARIQLRHGADTDIRDVQALTPLLLAVRYNQLDVLQVLLQKGARTDASAQISSMDPSWVPASTSRTRAATGTVDVNALDARGMTALHHACDYPNAFSTDTPPATSSSEPQYLFDAAHVEVVEALIHAGAALDVRRSSDWATPLRCAIQREHFLVAKTLVNRGAYSGVTWWLHKVNMFVSPPWTRDPAHNIESFEASDGFVSLKGEGDTWVSSRT
ncbi:Ankyrin repeat [Phytophthora infestans]|uniref:Ankyrin repeat n=1 Tax=Phytophthora infestans TaxID=4787 RepID=A0A8S9TWD7_PHYIN|nr:Ankyrin repeat [Phytophthora infestans]